MKIRQKLRLNNAMIVSIVFLMGLATVFSLYKANNSTQVLVGDKFGNAIWANQIINALNQNAILVRDMFIIMDDDTQKTAGLQKIEKFSKQLKMVSDSLENKMDDPNEKMIFAELKKSISSFNKYKLQLMNYLSSGDFMAASALLSNDFSNSQTSALIAINKMVEFENNQVKSMGADSSSLITTTMIVICIFIIIGLTTSLILSYVLAKGISKPLDRLVIISKNIAKGQIDVNLNSVKNDEIGDLIRAMGQMSVNIESLVREANQLAESTIKGNWEMRADETKYDGEFKELIVGINNTIEALTTPLNMTADYVSRISVGVIPNKITGEFSGSFAKVNSNLNRCIDSINLLVKDSKEIFEAAIIGDLKYRADDSKLQGEFKNIIGGVNSTLDRLVGLIDEMPIGVQIVDNNHKALYMNKLMETMNN